MNKNVITALSILDVCSSPLEAAFTFFHKICFFDKILFHNIAIYLLKHEDLLKNSMSE